MIVPEYGMNNPGGGQIRSIKQATH